ncbi:MAG: hypothetical protein E7294_07485 [Lachnospiraceae bacterium]|nr:hypothetical protein [Lachnospiraceae bacterium]
MTYDVIEEVTHSKELKDIKERCVTKGGRRDMCVAITEMKEESRKEGRKEGRLEAIINLMKNMKWSAEQAMTALDIPVEEWDLYKEKL